MARYSLYPLLLCFVVFAAPSYPAGDDSARIAASNLRGIDLHSLPTDNGNVTTAAARRNYVFVCTTAPLDSRRGGARHSGPWIHKDGTFDASAKPHVEGSVEWPNHGLSIIVEGDERRIHTNDLPDVPTGIFPIQPGTTAFQYDTNPNSIESQNLAVAVPSHTKIAGSPSCLPPGGPIGILLNGGELFNSLDAAGRNAVEYEIQDNCWGHPQRDGAYHYHSLTPCMNLGDGKGTSPLLGYAFDGFGIYGPYQDGKLLSNQDLDQCHGTTSTVEWEGKRVRMYHYVANFEYPFTLGCYRGTPVRVRPRRGPGRGRPGPGRIRRF